MVLLPRARPTRCRKEPGPCWSCSSLVLASCRRTAGPWPDEFAVWGVPAVVLLVMSFGTDINLGLRYILPAFPYVFISGKLAPGFWPAGRPVPGWPGLSRSGLPGGDVATVADPSALSGLLQRDLGRPGPRLRAPDRQQPGLGPGPRQPRVWVDGTPPASVSGWPISARSTRTSCGSGVRVSTGSSPRRAGHDPADQRAGRGTSAPPGSRTLCHERLVRPGPALLALRQLDAGAQPVPGLGHCATPAQDRPAFGYFQELTPIERLGTRSSSIE